MKPIYGPSKKTRKKRQKRAKLQPIIANPERYKILKREGKWLVYLGQENLKAFDYYNSCFNFIKKHQRPNGP